MYVYQSSLSAGKGSRGIRSNDEREIWKWSPLKQEAENKELVIDTYVNVVSQSKLSLNDETALASKQLCGQPLRAISLPIPTPILLIDLKQNNCV
jgi:hypothetical protein